MFIDKNDKVPPLRDLGFGKYFCPWMATSTYENGRWSNFQIEAASDLKLSPAAKALHYGQEIFEGVKAFLQPSKIALFRPDANIKRMTHSAEVLSMPAFPEKDYLAAMKALIQKCKAYVPPEPGALYLRPTMVATTPTLGVAPATEYTFFILASPVGGYFGEVKSDSPAAISVLITEKFVRAVRGGVGSAKTAANYAAGMRAVAESKKLGFTNTLFIDAIEKKYIEELSGMNIFVVEKGILKTPLLNDTILAGVTRDSILKIAKDLGIKASEESISVDQLIGGIQKGEINEVFACGTAAVITAITEMGWQGKRLQVSKGEAGELTSILYKNLLDVFYGRKERSDWFVSC